MQPISKGDRLLVSFRRVAVQPEHLIADSEGISLVAFGIAAPMAKKLVAFGARKRLAREIAPGEWRWRQSFLQAAFQLHASLFGADDLMPKARAFCQPDWGFVLSREGDHSALLQGSTAARQRWGKDTLRVLRYETAEEADAAVQALTDFDDNARVVACKEWLRRLA